jgi:hypothetical protein
MNVRLNLSRFETTLILLFGWRRKLEQITRKIGEVRTGLIHSISVSWTSLFRQPCPCSLYFEGFSNHPPIFSMRHRL